MRDPARIDDVLAALRAAWAESPDLRLEQLIVNTVRPSNPCPEIIYTEDDALAQGLNSLRELLQATKDAGTVVDRR
jgi:uncharacterized protein YihD (DUF1040 family)